VSLQRAAMILPFIGLAFYFFTKTWMRLAIGYASLSMVIALGIVFSDAIHGRLDEANQAIASEGRWASTVLRVGTFSDRLRGWERLKQPSTYSLLGAAGTGDIKNTGIGKGDYHDVVNVILDATGVAGLALTVLAVIAFAAVVHRIIFGIRDIRNRSLARLLMAAMVPIFVSGMLGGANFHANPFNLIMWMHIGAIYCLLRYDRRHRARKTPDESSRQSSLTVAAPKRQVAFAN
jgi:heme A synthase